LQFYEASIAYGILTECREVGGTPAAAGSPAASPVAAAACRDPERTIGRLREAVVRGEFIAITAVFQGIELPSLPTMRILNPRLAEIANELEGACGLQPAGTASAAAMR
jgi:hypothetical protein